MSKVLNLLNRGLHSSRKSLQAKLLLFFLISSVLPLPILGILSYFKSSEIIDSQFGNYGNYATNQLVYQTEIFLNELVQTYNEVLMYVMDPTLISLHKQQPETYSEYLHQSNFIRFLESSSSVYEKNIYVITPDHFYYGSNQDLDLAALESESWWNDLTKANLDQKWIGFYQSNHHLNANPMSNETMIGLVVQINNQYGVLQNSRMLIEMNASKLLNTIHTFEQDTNTKVRIVNNEGNVIYQTDDLPISDSEHMIWEAQLQTSDWVIQTAMSHSYFYKSSNTFRSFTIITIIVSAILAFSASLLFSYYLAGRIKKLKNSMKLAAIGNLGVRAEEHPDDELGQLGSTFNKMVIQIQHLIKEISATEKQKKEAELRAFHYQINPHMLLNTINTIQWKVLLKGDTETQTMLYHMAMLLEENLDISQELVPVEKELEIIGHFLSIQEIRYGNSFTYHLQCHDALKSKLILRMTLQPLFENIFFHAFEDGKGKIDLIIEMEEKDLIITLHDNGKGIPQHKVYTLLDPKTARNKKKGLGLFNVDQKIKLRFGEPYGLTIRSTPEEGTTILIRMPQIEA